MEGDGVFDTSDGAARWIFAKLQNLVLRAETTGGWLPLNRHHFCSSGCPVEAINPAV